MKGMIFAAGLGTRLHPITQSIPKALVEVGGKPMLGRVIEKLKLAGVRELVVNVHHFPEKIRRYLAANGNFGIDIHISDESACLLDTGGGVLKASDMLDGDEPILLHNADIFTDFDLSDMVEAHVRSGADATLLASERHTSRYLLFDNERMCGWVDKRNGQVRPEGLVASQCRNLAFGGVHIISARVLKALASYASPEEPFSITPFYIDKCSELDIRPYLPGADYAWFDIGKPETLELARKYCEKSEKKSW